MIGPVYQPVDKADSLNYLAALINLYEDDLGNVVGGSLHVVLSDHNLEDNSIKSCLLEADKHCDHVGVAIAKCLLELTMPERIELWNFMNPGHKLDWKGNHADE